uniref:Dual specificity protein phosphatase 16 n=1 Tax=Geospiza parvula TaxID=87175 RepID=A0A8C3MND1_GEOPR
MAHEMIRTQLIVPEKLVALLESGTEKLLLIDSRPFVEYNTSHILDAININCSKLMKRRLQQDKVLITELIQHSAKHKIEIDCKQEVVVYDQSSKDVTSLSSDCFLTVLLGKLEKNFSSVYLLSGGFAEFSSSFPGLCEGKSTLIPTCISQPCLPVSNTGPTRILPHLYLGCQRDVLNKELMQQNDIGYVLNASNTCPKPDFIPESHFLRVPVNDSFCEKILPWLDKSVDFIEKAKASNGHVLVHCLAGISRSATIAIAYIMKRMDMSLDEAYRFVKEKRPTISPNFNFLGQLLDFEKKLKNQSGQPGPISKLKLLHLEKSSEQVQVLEGGQSSLSPGQLCLSAASELLEPKPTDPRGHPAPLEDGPLVQGINGLHISLDKVEDSNRLKRSFSLDIKSVSYSASSSCVTASVQGFASSEDTLEYYKHAAALEGGGKLCQFSPVQEVSEQSPESSPDQEEAARPQEAPGPLAAGQRGLTATRGPAPAVSPAPQRQRGGHLQNELRVRALHQPAAPGQVRRGAGPQGLALGHPGPAALVPHQQLVFRRRVLLAFLLGLGGVRGRRRLPRLQLQPAALGLRAAQRRAPPGPPGRPRRLPAQLA